MEKERMVSESFTAPLDLVRRVEAIALERKATDRATSKATIYREALQFYLDHKGGGKRA